MLLTSFDCSPDPRNFYLPRLLDESGRPQVKSVRQGSWPCAVHHGQKMLGCSLRVQVMRRQDSSFAPWCPRPHMVPSDERSSRAQCRRRRQSLPVPFRRTQIDMQSIPCEHLQRQAVRVHFGRHPNATHRPYAVHRERRRANRA